jgi:hypothetical protein
MPKAITVSTAMFLVYTCLAKIGKVAELENRETRS